MRILLLQAREADDPMREAERHSFARRAGLEPDRFTPHDLLGGPPSPTELRRHDAVMIGGSGDYYVSKGNLPRLDETLDLIRELVESAQPTFASCFGFQLLVAALGGEIVHAPDRTEVGTFPVTLTEGGRVDELFGELPERFPAQMGRKDLAASLPEGVVHLASSERCPYHALRVPGAPIWATQFHPELDREENLERFRRYMDGYAAHLSAAESERAMEAFLESPESETLIPRFLELVFGD